MSKRRHKMPPASSNKIQVPRKTGTITMPPGLPSPSGGKSSAFDFSQALMQGNPVAVQAAEDAMRKVDWPLDSIQTREEEASVADKFVASTYDWCKFFKFNAHQEKKVQPLLLAYRKSMREASRFVLDNEFVRISTELASRTPAEKLLYRLQYCTLPYEKTWVEFDLRVKVATMRRLHGLDPDIPGIANRCGVLLERIDQNAATVTIVCEGMYEGQTAPNMSGYLFSTDERTLEFGHVYHGLTPFSLARRLDKLKGMPEFDDIDPALADEVGWTVAHGSMWGYTKGGKDGIVTTTHDMLRDIAVPEFLSRHGELAFTRFYDFFEHAGKMPFESMTGVMNMEITEFTGFMRWLVCVLAMINEVPVRMNHVMPGHSMRWGLVKRGPAMDYHNVTLRLPKLRPVAFVERKLSNVERKHKAHFVRSHWRTYLRDTPCKRDEHDWTYDEEHGYRLCGRCMSFSRLLHEHQRGDPTLGWVQKSYLIKPSKQE